MSVNKIVDMLTKSSSWTTLFVEWHDMRKAVQDEKLARIRNGSIPVNLSVGDIPALVRNVAISPSTYEPLRDALIDRLAEDRDLPFLFDPSLKKHAHSNDPLDVASALLIEFEVWSLLEGNEPYELPAWVERFPKLGEQLRNRIRHILTSPTRKEKANRWYMSCVYPFTISGLVKVFEKEDLKSILSTLDPQTLVSNDICWNALVEMGVFENDPNHEFDEEYDEEEDYDDDEEEEDYDY